MKYVIALTGYPDQNHMYPWLKGEQLLYLGEIENNKGHGVYMQYTGKTHQGYHTDNFFEYTDDHYDGQHCLSDFLVFNKGCIGSYFSLPKNLINLLIELNESHTPDTAENSFVIQAAALRGLCDGSINT